MRITTWNVNGLRALIRKEGWTWHKRLKSDIYCFQEIKARPDQLTKADLENFDRQTPVWNPAEKPGYSGVLSWHNFNPSATIIGLGLEALDKEGRVVQSFFKNIVLFNVYFPNGQRDHGRLKYKLDFYAKLLNLAQSYQEAGKHVIICGDFNTAHQEIDLKNHKKNSKTSGFLPEERVWIDKYIEAGFEDAFRILHPKKIEYTWWTYRSNARERNVGWRLDYFLISSALFPKVKSIKSHKKILGSDHCPVTLEIGL
ncbi:MAG: exodeoxyribonuclease III [Chloroflexota bacterium]